jgi:hypothetical protein
MSFVIAQSKITETTFTDAKAYAQAKVEDGFSGYIYNRPYGHLVKTNDGVAVRFIRKSPSTRNRFPKLFN